MEETRKRARYSSGLTAQAALNEHSSHRRPTSTALTNTISAGAFTHTGASRDFLSIVSNSRQESQPLSAISSISTTSRSMTSDVLTSEVASLKAELEHVESLRRLEKMKASNTEKKLKRQIISLEADANEARSYAEELQNESDLTMKKMKDAYDTIRSYEEELYAMKDDMNEVNDMNSSEELNIANKKNALLAENIERMEQEMNNLRDKWNEAETRANEAEMKLADSMKTVQNEADGHSNIPNTPISPAPPAVMTELNRSRVELAEEQCQNRSLSRKLNELEIVQQQLVQYRESSRKHEIRADRLEIDLDVLQKERESLRVVESRWAKFRKELLMIDVGVESTIRSTAADENTPPEIATIIRSFDTLKRSVDSLQDRNGALESQLDASKLSIQAMEKQVKEMNTQADEWNNEKSDLIKRATAVDAELQSIRAQEEVWKREAEGMRSLLATYKAVEDKMMAKGTNKPKEGTPSGNLSDSNSSNAVEKGLDLSLKSARDEVSLLKEQLSSMKDEKTSVEEALTKLQEENERISKKFAQIREALYAERAKAEKADERAFQAESLAGKGSYNEQTTNVLRFKDGNPLSNAIREKFKSEIDALKMALEAKEQELAEVTGSEQSSSKVSALIAKQSLDAQKLAKRLKESFRKKIGMFREGVYLITGFKIDMDDSERPRFTVRSIYSEREDDHLIFMWPKLREDDLPSSLDILETDMARVLSKTKDFEYMTKFQSLPAFMASTCLTLFESQTFVSE